MTRIGNRLLLPALLALALPLGASAASPEPGSLSTELAQARAEVHRELATARAKLELENLSLGQNFNFGKSRSTGKGELPKAEITPQGEFLIQGKAVPTDASQRRELLNYRSQVIGIAQAGIDIGERSAEAALAAVDRGLFSLILSAVTGTLENKIESTLKTQLEPGLRQLCERLPALLQSQQRLQTSLPAFRPYANLQPDDVSECSEQVAREFAVN